MNKNISIIGVDIGKTKISCALFTADGNCLMKRQFPSASNAQEILCITASAIRNFLECEYRVVCIAIAVFGVIDYEQGYVIRSDVVPDWYKIPIRDFFENMFEIPVIVENDVKAAAIGEYYKRFLSKNASFLYFSMGTNIGLAYILSGEIIRGNGNRFGEIASFTCENGTLLGDIIGGKGIEKQYFELTGNNLHTADIFELFIAGDVIASGIIEHMIETTVNLLRWLSACFASDVIVLGGGMICKNSEMYRLIAEGYNSSTISVKSDLDIAIYGEHSGLFGSYVLGMRYYRRLSLIHGGRTNVRDSST